MVLLKVQGPRDSVEEDGGIQGARLPDYSYEEILVSAQRHVWIEKDQRLYKLPRQRPRHEKLHTQLTRGRW